MVWVKLGYGTMLYAKKMFKCPCPKCNVNLKPENIVNIGYRYAKVKFEGRKATN